MQSVFFIGIGGIGMSALARYFRATGHAVGGYDRCPSALTARLEEEGIFFTDDDAPEAIPDTFKVAGETLVVYTPAIPSDCAVLRFYQAAGFALHKRAEVLGIITRDKKALCVAGTHGKTTTSAMLATILDETDEGCNAFLGGILNREHTNCLLAPKSPWAVVEADEYDRSFHQLHPWGTAVTATDPDHLDIYGTPENYIAGFAHYVSLLPPSGCLVRNVHAAPLEQYVQPGVRCFTYGRTEGDFHATDLQMGNGKINYTLCSPIENIEGIGLGVPVAVNIDNSIAAAALAQLAGISATTIKKALVSFRGVERRFDFALRSERLTLLSDYAHHPEEVRQSIASLREVFTGKKLTAVFQPHLYSRTKDFYHEFAAALGQADEVILTEIYPARELPIEGVSSELILRHLPESTPAMMCRKTELPEVLSHGERNVIVLLGAGDMVDLIPEILLHLGQKPGQVVKRT